jgi:hypothetical protein
MGRKYLLISIPEKFESKFDNMLKNLNAINNESDGIIIINKYNGKPEYVAIPKKEE